MSAAPTADGGFAARVNRNDSEMLLDRAASLRQRGDTSHKKARNGYGKAQCTFSSCQAEFRLPAGLPFRFG
jgi:hypothetical protein